MTNNGQFISSFPPLFFGEGENFFAGFLGAEPLKRVAGRSPVLPERPERSERALFLPLKNFFSKPLDKILSL